MANKYSEYKGLVIGKEEPSPVSENEINDALNSLLARSVTFEEVDKVSSLGDMVNIDFEGFVDGVSFEGGKGESYDLELGSNTFIPGFEDQLVGHKKDEEVEVNVTFPENYQAENLKGKKALFKCKVNQVKEKHVPSLDDEFAKKNGLNTIEELRDALKDEIEHRNKQKAINDYFDKLCAHMIENSEIEVTKEAEEKSLQNILAYYQQMVSQYGMTLEQYLQMAKKSMDEFKETLKPEVIKGAKINMILAYVSEQENIVVSPEEVENELGKLVSYYHLNEQQLKEFKEKNLDDFKQELVKRLVFEYLVNNNN